MNDTKIVRAEFHCHSAYSPDSTNRLERLLQVARQNGVQRLCITDHDTIQGALKAREMDPELVVVAEEVQTSSGEIIAYFLEQEIPSGLSPQETIALMRAQGAFISLPHPCDAFRANWKPGELEHILPLVDAVEVFNARCFKQEFNEKAAQLAEEWKLPFTVGSDAHTYPEVGLATLTLPDFHSTEELKCSIRQAQVHAEQLTSIEHLIASGMVRLSRLFSQKRD